MKITMDISDSCQKDVREFKNLTTICSRWSNHRYEVHPIGGETEVIMDIHAVIVHNNLILNNINIQENSSDRFQTVVRKMSVC